MKNQDYKDYFSKHYKLTLQEEDIMRYEQWFSVQWSFIQKKVFFHQKSAVLELGSGVGGVYSLLLKKGKFSYTGIELDKKVVDFTNTYFHTKSFMHTSIETLKTNKTYRYIFGFEILEHLESPFPVIKKMHTMLDKKGIFVGTSPYPFTKNIYADKTHLHVLHPENWKRLFLYAGFTSVDVYPMSFFPFLWRIHPKLNIRLPFYVGFPGFISTTLIVAKKT